MNIPGRKVTLRAIEEKDLPELHRWSNDPAIASLLGGFHFPSSLLQQARWLERIQSDQLNYRFAIDTPKHGLIGTANLIDLNWKDGNATHGMLLGDKDLRGKGYGTDTIMAIMRYAFDELKLHRLDTTMIAYNDASIGVYTKKCGWTVEGRRREWYFRNGRRWDQVMAGVTAADYARLVESTGYWTHE